MAHTLAFLLRPLGKAIHPVRLTGIAALFVLGSGQVVADNSISAELIERSGIGEHLALVPDSIVHEAWPKHQSCYSGADSALFSMDEAAFNELITMYFGVEQSTARAVQAMSDFMNVKQLYGTKKFFDSDLGQRIVAAEKASKEIEEDEFVVIAEEYFDSEQWTEERELLIRVVYEATRAARFVSILNGELSVAVAVTGHCEPSLDSYKELSNSLKTTRTDARMIEPIMANDLVLIIATIFRDFSDKDMIEYAEFARSAEGKSFFNALLESTRKAIAGGLKGARADLISQYAESLSTAEAAD